MRERQREKHAHAARLTTIANSVITTFGLDFFPSYKELRSKTSSLKNWINLLASIAPKQVAINTHSFWWCPTIKKCTLFKMHQSLHSLLTTHDKIYVRQYEYLLFTLKISHLKGDCGADPQTIEHFILCCDSSHYYYVFSLYLWQCSSVLDQYN